MENTVLILPMKYKVWGWPAAVNFILGGTATGFYLLIFLMKVLQDNTSIVFQSSVVKLLPPVMVILGFLALAIEAGRPMRGYHLLCNLRSSWMSFEVLAGAIFIISTILDYFLPHLFLKIIAVVSATGLIISHGFIFYHVRGVTAWNVPFIPLHFIISGLTIGFGLLLFVAALDKWSLRTDLMLIGLICVMLNLVVWLIYLRMRRDTAFSKATEGLRNLGALFLTVGIGHLLPIILLLLLLFGSSVNTTTKFPNIISVLAGLAIVAGGVRQKVNIILGASYLRGITMGADRRWCGNGE